MASTTLEDLIGSKLVFGFPGTKVTSDIVRHFQETRAGGIILFRINFESSEQLRKLIADLENALQRRLLVTVDHEGGRVIMYRDGVTIFPDNLAMGRSGRAEHARRQGEIAARELRALGTDVNFAPVVDVLTGDFSPNIGIRAYGSDERLVSELAVAYIKGLQSGQGLKGGGVSATAKHFPGQGQSPMDAHLQLPTLDSSWDDIRRVHAKPYVAAIDAGVDVIMSSHPRYPRLDPAPDAIATFSRRIITDYLRGDLAFKGVVASDDLEMGAIREIAPIGLAAVKAAAAGHDLILSCHDLDAERTVFRELVEAYKNRSLLLAELEASVDRIEQLKAKRKTRFEGSPARDPEGDKLARQIAREAVTILQEGDKALPLPASLRGDVGVVFPKLSSLAARIMIEKPLEDETTYLHGLLGKFGGRHALGLYNLDPTEENIRAAAELAQRSTVTLFFLFDGHLFPGQQKLLVALQQAARKLVVVPLRDPYDKKFLRPADAAITCFGFRRCQIEAVVERIYGE